MYKTLYKLTGSGKDIDIDELLVSENKQTYRVHQPINKQKLYLIKKENVENPCHYILYCFDREELISMAIDKILKKKDYLEININSVNNEWIQLEKLRENIKN